MTLSYVPGMQTHKVSRVYWEFHIWQARTSLDQQGLPTLISFCVHQYCLEGILASSCEIYQN